MHLLVFIRNSIFYFSLNYLAKNYDLSLKVAKTLLGIIFKFSMISAQYLPLRAFFNDFKTSFVDIMDVLFYLSVVTC